MTNIVFTLFVLFQIKHFLADYPLQGKYMLGKFALHGWVKPLAAHAGVHAAFTLFLVQLIIEYANFPIRQFPKTFFALSYGLPLFDFLTHFTMDRIKVSPNMLGRFKDFYDRRFWWCLGLDQMVHHLSDTVIIYVLIKVLQSTF